MIDFGKRLTQKRQFLPHFYHIFTREREPFFFLRLFDKNTRARAEKKKREVLLAKNSAVVTRVPHLCICK